MNTLVESRKGCMIKIRMPITIPHFLLRKAKYSDMEALMSIYMHPGINRFLNFEIMSKEEFKPIFSELMRTELYVLENSQKLIATCTVERHHRRANHVASLGSLAVHPGFQRKNIGIQFLQILFEKLKNEGIKRIDLCVEADNIAAQIFYKKLGFQQEGILKKYFKRPDENYYVDEYLMSLIIE